MHWERMEKTYRKKKIHFHCVNCTNTAETRLPPAAPTGAIAPNKPIARFLCLPGGKLMPSRATALGVSRPPSIPVRLRMKDKAMMLLENPVPDGHITPHTHPTAKIFL